MVQSESRQELTPEQIRDYNQLLADAATAQGVLIGELTMHSSRTPRGMERKTAVTHKRWAVVHALFCEGLSRVMIARLVGYADHSGITRSLTQWNKLVAKRADAV